MSHTNCEILKFDSEEVKNCILRVRTEGKQVKEQNVKLVQTWQVTKLPNHNVKDPTGVRELTGVSGVILDSRAGITLHSIRVSRYAGPSPENRKQS